MKGSRELTRAATAYLASLTFALTFLTSTALGATGTTALIRGSIVATLTWFVGRLLLGPAIAQIVTAIARDRAARDAERAASAAAAAAAAENAATADRSATGNGSSE